MAGYEVVKVLVLSPTVRTRFLIQNLPREFSEKHKFIYYDPETLTPGTVTSLQDCLESVREIVVQEQVDILNVDDDIGALLRAALTQEFPHLRGPSVESVFLCFNKYYTRCFLDPHPIPFACFDLLASDLNRACEEALQEVGVPAFFKPCCMSASRGIASIASTQELKDFALSYNCSDISRVKKVDAAFMNPFYARNIDEQKYPLANRPTAIVERHMGGATHVNADGYVFDGKIYHWSISDNIMSRSKPHYYFGAAHPTLLPDHTQKQIWQLFDTVVERLIAFKFNNSFVNVEVFILNGEVKLMEVNPRCGGSLGVSRETYTNGDRLQAQLKLAQGIYPGVPQHNGRHALYGYVRTCANGAAREFYDYSYRLPELFPEVEPECLIDGIGESGTILARMFISGDSREEVMEKHRSVCRRVLLKPELSVWQ